METKTITRKVSDLIEANEEPPLPLSVIPNYMGINLCSVDSLSWTKQKDGQLVDLTIHFIPADDASEQFGDDEQPSSRSGSLGQVTRFAEKYKTPLLIGGGLLALYLIFRKSVPMHFVGDDVGALSYRVVKAEGAPLYLPSQSSSTVVLRRGMEFTATPSSDPWLLTVTSPSSIAGLLVDKAAVARI